MEEENKFIAFVSKHWSKLLLGVLAVACLAVWAERFLKSDENQSRQDFLIVQQIFDKFQKGQNLQEESLESAENILARHPELHPKYDAMLALAFFSQAKEAEGLKYAQLLLKKVKEELPPYYEAFARCTLLISEANYSQAYKDSLALHDMLQGQQRYQNLDAMNTLRLLFLAERLGDSQQKQAFWKKLEHHPGFAALQPLFHEGTLSLEHYIQKTTMAG
jgi:hypothetical protein